MHAGRALVTDTRTQIIRASDTDTLEDAFIQHILAEIPPEPADMQAVTATEHSMIRSTSGFSMRRLLAYTTREAMQVRRDPVRLAFAFLGSALLLLIMSFGNSQEVRSGNFVEVAVIVDGADTSRAGTST